MARTFPKGPERIAVEESFAAAPALMSVAEAARQSGYSRGVVYAAIRAGLIRTVKVGERGDLRIPKAALIDWIVPPASDAA